MWTQLVGASWNIPYVGGWCLKYVQDAFETDHPYPSAMDAWNAGNGNHAGELPPAGVAVPVYFKLGSVPEGHVAISLSNGTVASSSLPGSNAEGFIYPNLQALIDDYGKYNGGCTYLGWSEDVGTERVVAPIEPVVVNATRAQVIADYIELIGRDPTGVDEGGIAHYMQFPNDVVRNSLYRSDERKVVMDQQAIAVAKAIADKQAADAETARLADLATQKAAQDALDAQKLIDAQTADAKARADTTAQATSDHSFILWLQSLIKQFNEFITNFRKGK